MLHLLEEIILDFGNCTSALLRLSWKLMSLSLHLMFLSLVLAVVCAILLRMTVYLLPSGEKGMKHIAFFHPYCNAGGGGERVLWASIRAIQQRYPLSECYVYTGDCEVTPDTIISNVERRFGIVLRRQPRFIYLRMRAAVEAKSYPYFTLLLQSLGSVLLAAEALGNFRPDILIDTMGYAFTYPVFRFLGGSLIASYTHYPTISTDMLDRVSQQTEAHNNRAFIANSACLSFMKIFYYNIFSLLYWLVGRSAHVVMVNSSWTRGHIEYLWKCSDRIHTVFPPCNTDRFSTIELIPDDQKPLKTIVSIGQFRPEKNYPLQLKSFSRLLQILDENTRDRTRLVLIGGVRNKEDEERVENLKQLASDLNIAENIIWKVNASFPDLLTEVQKGTVGLHTMWNEHFGICVVECMAGGLIMVAHDSGGPKMDIVKPFEEQTTGFLASDVESFAQNMKTVLNLSSKEKNKIIEAARKSVARFSDNVYMDNFLAATSSILDSRRAD